MIHPYFSIITPTYNREDFISKTIKSCLDQSYKDFELIIIDDNSSDNTLSVINNYKDPRIKVFQHRQNLGPCPSRNTGIKHSQGSWYLILDSDFELLPDALNVLFEKTLRVQENVGNILSCCLWDTGEISPYPNSPEKIMGYIEYLKWSDSLIISESFNCISANVFKKIQYPNNRSWETKFHLDLAYQWQIWLTQDRVVKISTKAKNRLTTAKGSWAKERIILEARDKLEDLDQIWRLYGSDILRFSPSRHLVMLRDAGRLNFLCGNRQKGIYYIQEYINKRPFDKRAWLIIFFGLIGPRALTWAITLGR